MDKQNLIINADLSISPYESFSGFSQSNKARYLVCKLKGWALDDGYELYFTFSDGSSSPIEKKLLYNSGEDCFFCQVPTEVMNRAGPWSVRLTKKYPDANLSITSASSFSFLISTDPNYEKVETESLIILQSDDAIAEPPEYKKAKITVDRDLTVHPVGGFDGFSQNSIGTQMLSATLNGWALEDGAALFFAFEKLSDGYNYSVAPVLTAMDFQLNTYWILVPDEVMKVSGEWRLCVYKKLNFNKITGTADYSISGVPFYFTVRNSIKDSIDGNITVVDLLSTIESYRSAKQELSIQINEAQKTFSPLSLSNYATKTTLQIDTSNHYVLAIGQDEAVKITVADLRGNQFKTVDEFDDTVPVGDYQFVRIKN